MGEELKEWQMMWGAKVSDNFMTAQFMFPVVTFTALYVLFPICILT